MPIPAGGFKAKVVGRGEVLSPHGSDQLDQQHGHAHRHMETMEACQHEKGGTIDAGVERQPEQHIRFIIFRRLQAKKNHGKTNGNAKPAIKLFAVAREDCGVRDMNRCARRQENQGIPHWQPGVPGVGVGRRHRFLLRNKRSIIGNHLRVNATHNLLGCCHRRPGKFKTGPQ